MSGWIQENRNAYTTVVRKATEIRHVARSRAMRDDEIKIHLEEVGRKDVDGIKLA
jgi:hypothetical protein